MKITNTFILFMAFCSTLSLVSCNKIEDILDEVRNDREERAEVRTSAASYPEVVTFSSSSSSDKGVVYEVLPDPAALDPSQSPTPFSNRVAIAGGSYDYKAVNRTEEDSEDSKDNVPDFY